LERSSILAVKQVGTIVSQISGIEIMIKTLLGTAVIGLFLVGPAYAMDDMKCDDATMMKMQTDMDAMKDMAKKDMAMKSMEMAKAAMKDNKMDECMTQMKAASDAMKQ
jgi:hypothetical protein